MSFRQWLRELLDQGQYRSQYQMAAAFGSKQPTINHWLRGSRRPDLGSCAKISKAIGKPLTDIVEMVLDDSDATWQNKMI